MVVVNTVATAMTKPGEPFPENKLSQFELSDDSVAICISGGGSRAFSCAIGAFRALQDLGVMDKATYLSTASGGSWASAVYSYADSTDEELVGKPTQPDNLTMEALKASHGKMSDVIDSEQFNVFETAGELLVECKSGLNTLWEKSIGADILKPFDLDGKLFTLNETTLNDILERNSELKKEDFVTARSNKPYLIIHASLDGPEKSDTTLSSLQMTPLYTGCPFYQNDAKVSYHYDNCLGACLPGSYKSFVVGGGFIESFSFGCREPSAQSAQYGGACVCKGPKKKSLFTLDRAIGISSCAFAMRFKQENLKVFKAASYLLDPVEHYWPILSERFTGPQKAKLYQCGDGGNLENTGLLPVLQRGVKKAMMLISSSTSLFEDSTLTVGADIKHIPVEKMDDQFTGLFGLGQKNFTWDYSMNQVFPEEDLAQVL